MKESLYQNQLSVSEIVDMLKAKSGDIFIQIFPNATKHNAGYSVGSFAGEKGESLSICTVSGLQLGLWKEFNGAASGDILDLIRLAWFGGNKGQAVRWAKGYLGLSDIDPEKIKKIRAKIADTRKVDEAKAKRETEVKKSKAMGYYLSAVPLEGTLAAQYLIDRGVSAPMGHWPKALRFHEEMWHSETQQKHPCLIAQIYRGDGVFMTIHRIYLERLADGRVVKLTSVDKPKMVYSAFAGGFVPISKGGSKKSMSKMLIDERLMICEGIEDALILATACPDRRIIAAVSLGNVGAVAEFLPEACKDVMLIKDNDKSVAAKRGFERARKAHCIAGRVVRVGTIPLEFKDINDMLDSLVIMDRENVND